MLRACRRSVGARPHPASRSAAAC